MSEAKKPLCGFLNILKPPGNDFLSGGRLRALAAERGQGRPWGNAGSGSLRRAAADGRKSGPAVDYMQEKEKVYVTEAAFGASTDTQDAQGQVLATGTDYPDETALRAVIPSFTGQLWQRPPMYSALKQDGSACMSWLGRAVRQRSPSGRSRCIRWNARA